MDADGDECITQTEFDAYTAGDPAPFDWGDIEDGMTNDDCWDRDEFADWNDDGGGDMDIPLEALCSVCGVKMMQAMSVFEELGALPPPRNHTHTHTYIEITPATTQTTHLTRHLHMPLAAQINPGALYHADACARMRTHCTRLQTLATPLRTSKVS